MQRALLIPYATNSVTGERITAEELPERMSSPTETLRLNSTLEHDTATRKKTRFLCPVCSGEVYPRAPVKPSWRYFWAHRKNTSKECPLAFPRILTPDQINRLIFEGRQEGDAHRALVNIICRFVEKDKEVVPDSLKIGEYERPSSEMESEFPYGRFPDIMFIFGRHKVVVEAQLATIALNGINGRRAFYDRLGATLLWVTRNFDPSALLRASVRDLIADQNGMLFSVDDEVEGLVDRDGKFRLRVWQYGYRSPDHAVWQNEILPLLEIVRRANPYVWSEDIKLRMIENYEGVNIELADRSALFTIIHDVLKMAKIEAELSDAEVWNISTIICILISLESGKIVGSGQKSIVGFVNHFDYGDRERYRSIVYRAMEKWNPSLLLRPSVVESLSRADRKLTEHGKVAFGRTSIIGQIRNVLFPKWNLDDANPVFRV